MLHTQSVRVLSSSGLIGTSACWWMFSRKDTSVKNSANTNSIKKEPTQKDDLSEVPFSSTSIDYTIRRGGW